MYRGRGGGCRVDNNAASESPGRAIEPAPQKEVLLQTAVVFIVVASSSRQYKSALGKPLDYAYRAWMSSVGVDEPILVVRVSLAWNGYIAFSCLCVVGYFGLLKVWRFTCAAERWSNAEQQAAVHIRVSAVESGRRRAVFFVRGDAGIESPWKTRR